MIPEDSEEDEPGVYALLVRCLELVLSGSKSLHLKDLPPARIMPQASSCNIISQQHPPLPDGGLLNVVRKYRGR